MKIIPGSPRELPIWLEPDPIYGPKDQAQDIRGREMEMKYTGMNLSRFDKIQTKKPQDQKETPPKGNS